MAVLSHRLGAVWESKLKLREGKKVKSVFSLGSCGLGGAVLGQVRPSLLLQRSCGVLLYEPQKVSHLGQELACYPGANFLLQHRGTGAFSILIFFSMANSNLLGGVVRALNFGA